MEGTVSNRGAGPYDHQTIGHSTREHGRHDTITMRKVEAGTHNLPKSMLPIFAMLWALALDSLFCVRRIPHQSACSKRLVADIGECGKPLLHIQPAVTQLSRFLNSQPHDDIIVDGVFMYQCGEVVVHFEAACLNWDKD